MAPFPAIKYILKKSICEGGNYLFGRKTVLGIPVDGKTEKRNENGWKSLHWSSFFV